MMWRDFLQIALNIVTILFLRFWCISVSSGRPVPAVAGRVGTVVWDLRDKNVEDLPKVAEMLKNVEREQCESG